MSELKKKQLLELDKNDQYSVIEQKSEASNKLNLAQPQIQASEVGFTIALPITLGALFGLWLDKKFGMAPTLTLTGLTIGLFISFSNLYYMVKFYNHKK